MTHIESTRFGTVEVNPDAVLEFPNGLIGLGGTRYALVAKEADCAFLWLHSVDDPSLALPVTRPVALLPRLRGLALRLRGRAPRLHRRRRARRLGDRPRRREPRGLHRQPQARPILVSEGRAHQVINEAPRRLRPRPAVPVPRRGRRLARPASRSRRIQGGTAPCSSSPAAPARRSCSATTSSSRSWRSSATPSAIGIQAPRSVPVYREEIWDAVRAENQAAAEGAPAGLPLPTR